MPDDRKLPTDAELSEADVERVLERAVEIDGARSAVTVSELSQAAREAGISEKAMLQAVGEILQERDLASAAGPGSTATTDAQVRSLLRFRTAAIGLLLAIVLLVIFFSLRIAPEVIGTR